MAISVNTVRNLTLFLLGKNNFGYISPEQLDEFSNLAQMKIFENLFESYNQFVNKQNRRLTNTEYADIPKNIREMIDVFAEYSDSSNFTYDSMSNLWSYNGLDLYRAEALTLVNGTTNKKVDIEEVQKRTLDVLRNNPLTAPSLTFPIYTRIGSSFRIEPQVPNGYTAELFYIRTPKKPKWAYNVINGNPLVNLGASDYQDVELHQGLFFEFMVTVLGYCGLNLRDEQVQQTANSQEFAEFQKQQQP